MAWRLERKASSRPGAYQTPQPSFFQLIREGSVTNSTELGNGKCAATMLTGALEKTASGALAAGYTSKNTAFQPFCNWICCVLMLAVAADAATESNPKLMTPNKGRMQVRLW